MDKKDRILFIGQVNDYYPTRRKVLEYIKNNSNLPLDIFITDRKLSYIQFLEKMNEYKFILNPLGTGEFLNLRFYEALKLGCIPIQEVTDKMLSFYPELNYSINFTTPNEISIDIDLNTNTFNYYLEDYFKQILAK